MPRIVLASGSPRRRTIFEAMRLDHVVIPADTKELGEGEPVHVSTTNAYNKALAVKGEGDIVVGCDTLVAVDGQIIGKQDNPDDAKKALLTLSGKTHRVISGLAILTAANDHRIITSDTTLVTMREISDTEAQEYADSGEWQGKAGAYSIQGDASMFVESLQGSMFNVIGFPLEAFIVAMRSVGMDISENAAGLEPAKLFPNGRLPSGSL